MRKILLAIPILGGCELIASIDRSQIAQGGVNPAVTLACSRPANDRAGLVTCTFDVPDPRPNDRGIQVMGKIEGVLENTLAGQVNVAGLPTGAKASLTFPFPSSTTNRELYWLEWIEPAIDDTAGARSSTTVELGEAQ